jgi:hypothetical protein
MACRCQESRLANCYCRDVVRYCKRHVCAFCFHIVIQSVETKYNGFENYIQRKYQQSHSVVMTITKSLAVKQQQRHLGFVIIITSKDTAVILRCSWDMNKTGL